MFNNVTRTGIEALAATHGGTQSLHTNALDEAIALPTDFSARIARNTQLFIQQETGTCRTIDPWGGSHYVERLTYELIRKAQAHIAEVEELGGMAKAIAAGIPKMRIEEAAARTQARIDSGTQTIVGVNKFQVTDQAEIEVLKVDNKSVRESQIAKLQRLKASAIRAVAAALSALTETARTGQGNLLERAVAAARAKATVGEISDAMEKVWGRHRAETRAVSGVYTAEAGAMNKDGAVGHTESATGFGPPDSCVPSGIRSPLAGSMAKALTALKSSPPWTQYRKRCVGSSVRYDGFGTAAATPRWLQAPDSGSMR